MKPAATDLTGVSDGLATATTPRVRPAPSRANDYYELTKPRMNFLVLVTTMVGYHF